MEQEATAWDIGLWGIGLLLVLLAALVLIGLPWVYYHVYRQRTYRLFTEIGNVQLLIERLRTWCYNDNVYVGLNAGQLQIRKQMAHALSSGMLIKFIERSLEILDALRRKSNLGIDYLQEGQLKLDSGQCQVCGDEIDSEAVYCRICRTPHHQDCWEYIGACSTYGCGAKKFLRAKRKLAR